jgi:N-acetylglutamate synthase-like GNAT family acetyltransferase
MPYERRKDGLLLTTERSRISAGDVEDFLRQSYWAAERSRERIERSIANSLCFAVIDENSGNTVAFSRIVTDYADFAWLCDVFVDPDMRGRGVGAWMLECVVEHPDLQGLRRIVLATADAHGLYERFGFTTLRKPERWMERTP